MNFWCHNFHVLTLNVTLNLYMGLSIIEGSGMALILIGKSFHHKATLMGLLSSDNVKLRVRTWRTAEKEPSPPSLAELSSLLLINRPIAWHVPACSATKCCTSMSYLYDVIQRKSPSSLGGGSGVESGVGYFSSQKWSACFLGGAGCDIQSGVATGDGDA